MARYVDAFVLPVPRKNLEAYRRLATKDMPFDVKRMTYGGFQMLVDLG